MFSLIWHTIIRSIYIKFKFTPSKKFHFYLPIRHDFSVLAVDLPSSFQSSPDQSVTSNRVSRCLARTRSAHKWEPECWYSPHLAYSTHPDSTLLQQKPQTDCTPFGGSQKGDAVGVCLTAIYLKKQDSTTTVSHHRHESYPFSIHSTNLPSTCCVPVTSTC